MNTPLQTLDGNPRPVDRHEVMPPTRPVAPTADGIPLWTEAAGTSFNFLFQLINSLYGMKHVFTFLSLLIWVGHTQAQSPTTQQFTYSGRIVSWSVPSGVTSLTIEARGAGGGNQFGNAGKGAIIRGTFAVTGGQSLSILVGQHSGGTSGGGGSFVVRGINPLEPLIIAGGGGGSAAANTNDPRGVDILVSETRDGQAGHDGGKGAGPDNTGGAKGKNGNGGEAGTGSANAGAGGGLFTAGSGNSSGSNGTDFLNRNTGGGATGIAYTNASTSYNGTAYAGGGGGGYSGGGGGSIVGKGNKDNYHIAGAGGGGGGGSYNAGANPVNTAGANSGDGLVFITYTLPCSPFTAGLANDGPLTCAKTSVKLTATGGLDGATYVFSQSAQTSGPTTATATATNDGPYSVTVTNPGGCSATAITTVVSTTAPPMVSIAPEAITICAGQRTRLMASGADTYRWSTTQTTTSISVSVAGPYSVTGTTTDTGCSNTATASVSVTPLANASFTGLPASVCVDNPPSPLSSTTPGGSFSGPGISGSSFSPASAGVGGPYSISYTVSSLGCPNTSVQTVTVNPLPQEPLIVTQSGHAYSGGVASLTVTQYSGNIILSVSGCPGGTITWSGGNSATLSISTANLGTQSFTAICTNTTTSCTSHPASAMVTVQAGPLQLLAPDYDCFSGAIHFNTQGGNGTPIEFFAPGITAWTTNPDQFVDRLLRTVADASPLTLTARQSGKETKYRFDIRAQCPATSNQAPKLSKAIPAQTALQGGTFAFRIPPGTFTDYENQPLVLSVIGLPDGLNFTANERLSGIPSQAGSFSLIVKATDPEGYSAQGVLVLTVVASSNSLQLLAPDYNCQTGAFMFKTQGGNASRIEYMAVGITGWTTNANQVVEKGLRNDPKLLTLMARQSGREVSLFFDLKARCGSSRQGVEESAESALQVVVLGNPVSGQVVDVLVRGVVGQSLAVRLMDSQGRVVNRQTHTPAGQEHRFSVPLPVESAGLLLLEVSTLTQRQTVRLVKSR